MIVRVFSLLIAACVMSVSASAQSGDNYPNRTITMVLPYPAGGSSFVIAQLIGEQLRAKFGQPVVVDTRGGAGGSIGTTAVARADPDGYTLLITPLAPIIYNPFTRKNLGYDATALERVADIAVTPYVLAVRSDFPATNVREFIAYAKAQPGKLNYGSNGGVGSGGHLATLLFEQASGIKQVHVPYAGSAPAVTAMTGGQIDFLIDNIGPLLALHRDGRVKIIAVADNKRAPELPDVPTFSEFGMTDFAIYSAFGIFAPPKTPKPILDKLNAAVNEAITVESVRAKFTDLNLRIRGGSREAFADFVAGEYQRWGRIIREANVVVD